MGCQNVGKQNPIKAEALALLLGVQKVKQLHISNLQIEGDSLIIIDHLRDKSRCPWEIELLMSYIKLLLQRVENISFSHVPRDGNKVADKVAHLSRFAKGQEVFNNPGLQDLIHKDAIG